MSRRLRSRAARMWHAALGSALDRVDRFAGLGHVAPSRDPKSAKDRDRRLGIAIVGCGFVADFYGGTLPLHPELELVAVTDRDPERAERFAARHGAAAAPSLDALLADPRVALVVNLTNPASHHAVTKASLEAGKHVYSEKPLAMVLGEAEELVALAEARGLMLAGAPCSILGETAQALGRALRDRAVGTVRLAYAELDDGPIHRMGPDAWASPRGTPWPWRDEFTVGCTLEHAGYYLAWLVAYFGPARSVTAFSTCLVPEKHTDLPPEAVAPDFSVACIRFASGVVARLTCGTVAPHDHALRIIGDEGELSVDECWHNGAPLRLRRLTPLGQRAESYAWLGRSALGRALYGLDGRRDPRSPAAGLRRRLRRHEMDYLLGIAEVAAALRERRACRLSARLALHVTEIALAIHNARETGAPVAIGSSVAPEELAAIIAG
jgi:predicted dehydrogenase